MQMTNYFFPNKKSCLFFKEDVHFFERKQDVILKYKCHNKEIVSFLVKLWTDGQMNRHTHNNKTILLRETIPANMAASQFQHNT